MRTHKSVRQVTSDGRGVLVVAMRRGDEVLALLEAVAPVGDRYRPGDVAQADAYARGRGGRARRARVAPPGVGVGPGGGSSVAARG